METLLVTRNNRLDTAYYRSRKLQNTTQALKTATKGLFKLTMVHTGDIAYKVMDDLTKTNYRLEYRNLVGLPALLTTEQKLAQVRNSLGQFSN